jgi:ABC-type polysaccharide/polyol phosphate export permease
VAEARRSTGFVLEDQPVPWRSWAADVRAHREVFWVLVRKDFQTRFKRASLGVLWAVAVPVLQGVVMAFVFARVLGERAGGGDGFGAYVLSGILAWAYFSGTIGTAATSIVDGAGLSDKVWFPRLLLVVVPATANLVGLGISLAVLLALGPVIGVDLDVRILVLVPASALLVAFSVALSLVLAALHVYFRDTRFVVQAALLVWLYVTPIVYPRELLGGVAPWVDLNPMTGVVSLFHEAVGATGDALARPVLISLAVTLVLLAIGLEAQRRYDRLFVDQL